MKTAVSVFFSATILLLFVVGQVESYRGKVNHDLCQYSPTGKDNCLILAWLYIGWVVLWCCLSFLAAIILTICYCCCGLEMDKMKEYSQYVTGILLCCSFPCLLVLTLCRQKDEEDTWVGAA